MTEKLKSRPWDIHKRYSTFPEADDARKTLISNGFEVRVVKRHRDETFDVKKRAPMVATNIKKPKKSQKKT